MLGGDRCTGWGGSLIRLLFTDIDFSTLESVLLRDTLNVREVVIFNAVSRWAEVECQRRDLDVTSENKREVLGEAFYLIRIPAMQLEEFANGPAQSGLLTPHETTNVFLYFTARNKPELPFKQKRRSGLLPQKCHRFQSSAYRSNQWRYRGRCDSIQFAVDRRIFVAGFGLYGSSNGATEYQVKIELKKNGLILGQTYTRFFSDGSSNTFPVMFDNPIQVEPDTFYTASTVLDGAELSYFGQEGMAELHCGKVTFQFQCSSESTNGTGVQGGQIPEVIFYCWIIEYSQLITEKNSVYLMIFDDTKVIILPRRGKYNEHPKHLFMKKWLMCVF